MEAAEKRSESSRRTEREDIRGDTLECAAAPLRRLTCERRSISVPPRAARYLLADLRAEMGRAAGAALAGSCKYDNDISRHIEQAAAIPFRNNAHADDCTGAEAGDEFGAVSFSKQWIRQSQG